MERTTEQRKKDVLKALSETRGIITDACRKAQVSRTQFYTWQKTDKEFDEAVKEVTEEAIDFVEGKLFELINGVTLGKTDETGELQIYEQPPCKVSTIFFLKTRAKHRGYIERQEVTGKDGANLVSIVVPDGI